MCKISYQCFVVLILLCYLTDPNRSTAPSIEHTDREGGTVETAGGDSGAVTSETEAVPLTAGGAGNRDRDGVRPESISLHDDEEWINTDTNVTDSAEKEKLKENGGG